MRLNLNGTYWKIEITNKLPADCFGICSSPNEPYKIIKIRKGLRPKVELSTLLHEIIHSQLDMLDEAYVLKLEKALMEAIWKTGWRKPKKKK